MSQGSKSGLKEGTGTPGVCTFTSPGVRDPSLNELRGTNHVSHDESMMTGGGKDGERGSDFLALGLICMRSEGGIVPFV